MTPLSWLLAAGWLLLLAYAIRWLCHHLPGSQPQPKRTAADVAADLREARRARDLTTCQAIWPDPPTWKTAAAQYRHDTAKQRKENEQ